MIAATLTVVACNNRHDIKTLPYRVNVDDNINNVRSVPLSKLGKILEYIPLDSDTACLLNNISSLSLTDSFIFVSDRDKLLKFDKKGRFIKQIGSQGRGPDQYSNSGIFVTCKEKREIFVLDQRIILVFDFDGDFKYSFKTDLLNRQMIRGNDDELILHPVNYAAQDDNTAYSLYFLDRTGAVKAKIPNAIKRVNGGLTVLVSPLYMYGGLPHFMEFGSDTLYVYKSHNKDPYVIFNLGRLKLPADPSISEIPLLKNKMWVYDVMESANLILIKLFSLLSDSVSTCVFNKASSEFSILKDHGFLNDLDGGLTFWPKKITGDSLMIDYTDAFNLIRYSRNHTSPSGEGNRFNEVASQLSETSNPVLILLRDK